MQYNNKTRDEIKTDVTDDFDKTQETGVGLEARNDYETYESGVRIAEKYQASMEKAFDKIAPELKGEMQAKREKLITELNQNRDNLSGRKLFVDAKPFIEKVSTMIDKVEDDALMLLEQAKQEKELHQKVGAESQGKSYIKLGKDGTMNLTKSVNKPRIDQVLGGVMKEGQAWLIDYTKCTNPRIQKKMKDIIGGSACYLVQGKDKQGNTTYTLQQKDGSTRKKINQRALIREGVSLKSPQVIQRMGKKKQEELFAQKIEKIKTDTLEVTKGLKMLKSGSGLHTALNKPGGNESTRKEFFEKTDARLSELVIMAKKNGRELAVDSVSKLRGTPGAKMELHFITGTEKNNINFLRKGKDKVSDECWDIIDNNETDYMNFVKQRLAQKWNDVSFLTQTEDIFADDAQSQKEGAEKTPEVMIESDRLAKVGYGLGIMRDIIQNVRQDKGDTRSSSDTELTGLMQYASNAIVAVEKGSVSESQLQKIVDKTYRGMLPFTRGRVPKDYVEDIVSGNRKTKKEAHAAARRFGDSLSIGGNTYTSFLKKYEMQEEGFEIMENADLNKLYQNINTKLDMRNEQNHKLLQSLYGVNNATGENSVESILRGADILPAVGLIAADKIKELCSNIKQQIEQTRETIDANMPTVKTMWADMEMKSAKIMAKSSKTQEDMALLQQYHVMKGDANLRQELFSTSANIAQEQMKLGAMQSIIQGPVATLFAKEAGGTSSDLFDDIVGAGGVFERSDENVVALGEGVKMIAEEVVFMVVSATLVASGVGAGAGLALAGSRIARLGRKIGKFVKLDRLSSAIQKHKKFATIVDKVKKSKVVTNRATRYVAGRSDVLANAVNTGLTHTLLATTYRGRRDKDFNEHLVSVLQNVGMYSILGIVGKSAQSGRIAKLFDGGSKMFNPKHINAGKFIAEEMMMNPMDLAINYAFADQSMGAQDIATNMVLGLVFEGMGAIKMPGSTTKQKIADLVLHKNAIQINGKKVSHEDAFKIIEANKKEIQNMREQYEGMSMDDIDSMLEKYDDNIVAEVMNALRILQKPGGSRKKKTIQKRLSSHDPSLVALCQKKLSMEGQTQKVNKSTAPKQSNSIEKNNNVRVVPLSSKQTPSRQRYEDPDYWSSIVDKRQSSYVEDFLGADALLRSQNIDDLSPAMRDFINLADDADPVLIRQKVEALQKEIGLTGKDVDGILGPKTHGTLKNHIQQVESKNISLDKKFDQAAQSVADNIFENMMPSTKTSAMALVKRFGEWLDATAIQPTKQFLQQAADRIKSIKIAFPDMKWVDEMDDVVGNRLDKIEKKISDRLESVHGAGKIKEEVRRKEQSEAINIKREFTGPEQFIFSDPKNPEIDIEHHISALKRRGRMYDEGGIDVSGVLSDGSFSYVGTYHGRPLVEVVMPNGVSEYFYKSSGWAGKEGVGVNGTTEGMRQVFGGFAKDVTINKSEVDNRFIKDGGYQNYYGVQTFKNICENMNSALFQKYGLSEVSQLNELINFQSQYRKGDDFIPGEGPRITNEDIEMHVQEIKNKGIESDGQVFEVTESDIILEHDFLKNPEMTLSNKSVELPFMSDGDMYEVHIGSKKLTIEKHEGEYMLFGEGENYGDLIGYHTKKLEEGANYILGRKTDLGQEFDLEGDRYISEQHVEVRVRDGVVYVQDLHSTNKTTIIKKESSLAQQEYVVEEPKKNEEKRINDDMDHYHNDVIMNQDYDMDDNFDDGFDDLFY